ncbi:MAG TPA: S41 family peptidase [Candidatus Didemnitutus sp.]|nr:S41 family peptidase [Candidatus Didemnitutus sp.]
MRHPLRRSSVLLSILLVCTVHLPGQPAPAVDLGGTLTSTEKQQLQREARLIVDLLQNHHYSGRTFREIDNRELLANYLNALDPRAEFLTAADGEFVNRRFDHSLKTVYVFRGDLQPGFEIFGLYLTRVHDRLDSVAERLARDFDFSNDETFTDDATTPTPADAATLDARWEKSLKNQVLREIIAGRTPEAARAEVARRYAELRRNLDSLDALAVRERFLESMIRSYDPHSGYFSADSAREFALDMEGAVAGIGADLRKEHGRCIVSSVQPGSPADLASDLAAGDIIEAVGEETGDLNDVAELRLQEIVARIRGTAGSTVRVAYRKTPEGERRTITLKRARVVLAAERAHGAISTIPGPDGPQSIGWIVLPAFYFSSDGSNTTSATQDVRELVEPMLAAGVSGLVLDLRANPGGALTEAVGISSLFLPEGTVMFSRGPDGKPKEQTVTAGQELFRGPLVVLTSNQSASASEIFSGAMKFHHRALIVGDTATFGKGTVQAYIELAKTQRGDSAAKTGDWGTLRLTTERFYLPNGGAVQHDGVASDVVLPNQADFGRPREAELPHALPAESFTPPHPVLPAAEEKIRLADTRMASLQKLAAHDIESLPEWTWWRGHREFQHSLQARTTRPLNEEKRAGEWAEVEVKLAKFAQERRSLANRVAFVTRPLEIAACTAAGEAHETKLRAALASGALPGLNRLSSDSFLFEDDQHHLQELSLDAIDFRDFVGDEATLAAAFSAGAARTVSGADIKSLLKDFALLEHRTSATLASAAKARLGSETTDAAWRAGCEALLLKIVEIDDEYRHARPALDVPLRESLRLAAGWATELGEKPSSP